MLVWLYVGVMWELTIDSQTVPPTLPLRHKPHHQNRNPLHRLRPLQQQHPPPSRPWNRRPALPPHNQPFRSPCLANALREQLRVHFFFRRDAGVAVRFHPARDGHDRERVDGEAEHYCGVD